MVYKITLDKLQDIVSKTYFANDGDKYERMYWAFTKERFPNCEIFWRYFVVPTTKRMEIDDKQKPGRTDPREEIVGEIQDINSLNYSLFLNLIYAYDHLQNFRLSSFEDFYVHLVSVCDLAEEFLIRCYLLILECEGKKSRTITGLTQDEVLEKAKQWYIAEYGECYKQYLKNGKSRPIHLLTSEHILGEYFCDYAKSWKAYQKCSQELKTYRNVIVHDVQIGKILVSNNVTLVPKKEFIKQKSYNKWRNIVAAAQNIQKIQNDFINMKEQMILDIGELELCLNQLWIKPIEELKKLIYKDKNATLLNKFNLELL